MSLKPAPYLIRGHRNKCIARYVTISTTLKTDKKISKMGGCCELPNNNDALFRGNQGGSSQHEGLHSCCPDAPEHARLDAVTFVHRFGSAFNGNFHFHCCIIDGIYSAKSEAIRIAFARMGGCHARVAIPKAFL